MDQLVLSAIRDDLEKAQRLPLPKLLELIRQKEVALGSSLPVVAEPVISDFTDTPFDFLQQQLATSDATDEMSTTSTFVPIKASQHNRQLSACSIYSQQNLSKSLTSDSSDSDSKEPSEIANCESTDSFSFECNMSQVSRTISRPISSRSSMHSIAQHMPPSITNLLGTKMLGNQALTGRMANVNLSKYQEHPKRIGKLVKYINGLWTWESPPSKVVLVTKPNDIESEWHLKHIFAWFSRKSIAVYVDPLVAQRYTGITAFDPDQINTSSIDLVISIGGDGTLLYINSLFQRYCPPILPFNCGSLGFLTPFSPKDIDKKLSSLFDSPFSITERTRLYAAVISPSSASQQPASHVPALPHSNSMRNAQTSQKKRSYTVLNEISLMRQESKDVSDPICTLDAYVDSRFVTTIQGDGALVSTPSGSTAYALSAGGVPVHPTLNCMLLTFICPHVMSGRQVCLPGSCVLKLKQPRDSRGSCAVAFDNRMRLELLRGEFLRIQVSEHCFPTINELDSSTDWFRALVRCLGWNVRIRQKAFDARDAVREKHVGDTDSDDQ
ncbi:putative Inorganic polyphosphate/ATP-NAD kinase [Giardia duodenalis]|uniref:Inorganic polyphosphate/ATP-NAD kinase n=1 Tax=Giardia intestinalis (strain ATCC 50803 / WB clone C6) TaxID=184922 RepID=A8B3D3_GIAIC|nr:putative Inorganic polyphosphate/ATP-NAD kinase [Giardia intestinalis]KAE8303147.1 putative Inorganic polyphosphate/ATP-NAD kinase [Giardia intestinalis]|eukprot:XP_001710188.1 Inorganic polyphosphate/ATP-NAD kinase, putative [Giardia lamblia ATCC 50803]